MEPAPAAGFPPQCKMRVNSSLWLAVRKQSGNNSSSDGKLTEIYMAQIDALFNLMFSEKASDLHLSSGNPPILRINGELTRVDAPALQDEQLKVMLYEIAPEYKIKTFEETGDVDFGY